MQKNYDLIIVGARVAGSSLAYECAKAGLEVLLLEKGRLPSDILSTHNFFNNALSLLRDMGVLEKLLQTGTPTYKRVFIQFEDAVMDGDFPESKGETECLCIRRTHLDRILFEHAAAHQGVTAIQQFRVTDVILDRDTVTGVCGVHKDGRTEHFAGRLVVGADGRHSTVRSLVKSERKICVPTDFASYVAYAADYRQEGDRCVEFYKFGEYIAIIFPTSDDLYVIGLMVPLGRDDWMERFKRDPETAFRDLVDAGFADTVSSFPQRLRESRFVLPVRGVLGYDNDWFQGMGKGWALVGDAHSFKDPAIGQGLHDAIWGSMALTKILAGNGSWESSWDTMAEAYEGALQSKMISRFELACQLTKNRPFTEDQKAVNRLIAGDKETFDTYLGMFNYASEPADFEQAVFRLLQGKAQN